MRSKDTKYKGERGAALITAALVIFAFTCIVSVPVLNFTATGVNASRSQGENVKEIYAAEAGVQDALWKIIHTVSSVPKIGTDPPLSYSIPGGVNGSSVNVTISYYGIGINRISSVAVNNATGKKRTIDVDVTIGSGGLDLSGFTKNAATCNGTITGKGSTINGTVWIPQPLDPQTAPTIPDPLDIIVSPITGWPDSATLKNYFLRQVDVTVPYTNSVINIGMAGRTGPLYAKGVSTYTMTGTGRLTGTIYIDGNLTIDNKTSVTLDGHTIFVTGSLSIIGANIYGPGAIIAVGNISFQPNLSPSYLFVMSVSGEVNIQPNGSFFGAIAGNMRINMQPGCVATWIDPGDANLNVPGLFNNMSTIETWNIH